MGTFLRWFFCDHKGCDKVFIRNIYGDEINHRNGNRSMWSCSHCGGVIFEVHVEEKTKAKQGDEDGFENLYFGW